MALRPSISSRPDPYILGMNTRSDGWDGNNYYSNTAGKTVRTSVINTGIRNLILIAAGQSNMGSCAPTPFTPVNASVVDNFNIVDGQNYSASDPLLGCTYASHLGAGGVTGRLADKFITAGKFDRVITVPISNGGTTIAMWGTGGVLNKNIGATMSRLAARGIIPGMTGVTWAFVWGQGESDAATSQASYTTSWNQVHSTLTGTGFNGRTFICKMTLNAGAVNANVQAAQVAVVNGSTIFSGGDADALTGANRQADNTHLSDTGMAAFATVIYNAMVASGAPY